MYNKQNLLLILFLTLLHTPAFSKNWHQADMQGFMHRYKINTSNNSYMATLTISKKGLRWVLIGDDKAAINTLLINYEKKQCYFINNHRRIQTRVMLDEKTGYCLRGKTKDYFNPLGTLLDGEPCAGFSQSKKIKTEIIENQKAEIWKCNTRQGSRLTQWYLPAKKLVIKIETADNEVRLIKGLNTIKLDEKALEPDEKFTLLSYEQFIEQATLSRPNVDPINPTGKNQAAPVNPTGKAIVK